MKVEGGKIIKPIEYKIKLDTNLWFKDVTHTYCSHCKKLTGCWQYQGHFMCNDCKNITSFWTIPPGYPIVKTPVRWSKDGKNLVTVEYIIEDNHNYE